MLGFTGRLITCRLRLTFLLLFCGWPKWSATGSGGSGKRMQPLQTAQGDRGIHTRPQTARRSATALSVLRQRIEKSLVSLTFSKGEKEAHRHRLFESEILPRAETGQGNLHVLHGTSSGRVEDVQNPSQWAQGFPEKACRASQAARPMHDLPLQAMLSRPGLQSLRDKEARSKNRHSGRSVCGLWQQVRLLWGGGTGFPLRRSRQEQRSRAQAQRWNWPWFERFLSVAQTARLPQEGVSVALHELQLGQANYGPVPA